MGPFQSSLCRVNIWGHFNPTPIDRVNKSISYSNTYRLTYKCYTFLEMLGQGLHIYQGIMKGGNFNPTPIDRVNTSISNSNTYRLTYKCYTFLKTSGQGLHN